MAESTSSPAPALPSTADPIPYVPVSWMAVAAITVAGVFAFLLLLLFVSAFTSKKPLIEERLLVLPVIAVVLSFAARRTIRNSEGTRTGEKLANAAWWMAVVGGLGYLAYLFAIDYSVRRDARVEVERWINLVRDDKIAPAFHRTLPPGRRQSIRSDNISQMEMEFRDPMLMFRNCDLVKLKQRNTGPGEFEFVPGSLKDWSYKPGMIDCTYTGTIKCPEGVFPIQMALKGIEGVTAAEGGGGRREWMVMVPQSGGFIEQDKAARTNYGWLIVVLEMDGAAFGKEFIGHLAAGPAAHPYLYRGYIAPGGNKLEWGAIASTTPARIAAIGGLAVAAPYGAGYTRYMETQFYRLPGGAVPTDKQRDEFLKSWHALGVVPAGTRLKDQAGNVADKENSITITDTVIEVRVPVEIPILGTGGQLQSARGRLVVACTDPATLTEVKQHRAAADHSKATTDAPDEIVRRRVFAWRVVRVESDMVPVSVGPMPGMPPGADGMGMGMPGG